MKILSRDFTLQEKLLLVFLSLVLVGLFYYLLVDQPARTALNTAVAEKASIQTELDSVNQQVARLTQMQNELDTIQEGSGLSRMESYNNAKAELALLNDILKTTTRYSISFSNVTRDGDQIRRSFSLQFTAPNYDTMKEIISQLAASPYRCLIGNISCSSSRRSGESPDNVEVQISTTATFYETMVGGTADAGLPADAREDSSTASSFDAAVIGDAAAG